MDGLLGGGAKGMLPPPLQNYRWGWERATPWPPLPTPMHDVESTLVQRCINVVFLLCWASSRQLPFWNFLQKVYHYLLLRCASVRTVSGFFNIGQAAFVYKIPGIVTFVPEAGCTDNPAQSSCKIQVREARS